MKLNRALLCLDCEEIIDASETACSCGSTAVFPLENWLMSEGGLTVEAETENVLVEQGLARYGLVGLGPAGSGKAR